MSFVVCIHGRTVPSTEGPCLDCAELETLRSLERIVRDGFGSIYDSFDSEALDRECVGLDNIRARRGPGALGACTCTAPESRLEQARNLDPACPQHGGPR